MTMIIYNGELIAGGYFISSGEVYSPGIARWDGEEWHAMGPQTSLGMSGPVLALCVYNGELYAGGNFQYAGGTICNGIAKWTGSTWQSVGIGMSGGEQTIRALKVYNGELYAGGSFLYMNGTYCLNIAKYNGISWSSVGGATGYSCSSSNGYVTDMEIYNDELYNIGLFTKIGSISANKIAKWNGSSWCSVEYGIDLAPRDLELFGGSLIVCGDLKSISGNAYNNIARYTSGTFTGINHHQQPASYSLSQNYPNPFNPATTIKYQIPVQSLVNIKVFDVTGREVSVLINEVKTAGEYSVSFNGAGLSSGVYFYRLDANSDEKNVTVIKKMVLIK
jgi:hypothetical protein